MIVGVTGGRKDPTVEQMVWLTPYLGNAACVHHGACVGADALAHIMARTALTPVTVHPPDKDDYIEFACLYQVPGVTVLDAKPPLDRNRDIVNSCDVLLALPDRPECVRSGTWATVRYAEKAHRIGWICYRNGLVVPIAKRKELAL